MKVFESVTIKKNGQGDMFQNYIGVDLEKAKQAVKTAMYNLTDNEKLHTIVELREWEIPNNLDLSNVDAVTAAMIESIGYNIIEI